MNFSKFLKVFSFIVGIVSVAAVVAVVVNHFLTKKDEDFCSYIECEDDEEQPEFVG